MRHVICRNLHLTLILTLILPLPALAIPAITCHCFTDRSYDPAHPAVADPYFLATTQNSFFAVLFKVDKNVIVMKKQKGTTSDDLWIAYWVASKVNASSEKLLQAKQDKEAWMDAIASLSISPKAFGHRFSNALNAKSSTANLAEIVVDDLFVQYQLLSERELAAMRQARASNQELIIATVIAAKTRQPAKQIFLEVKNNSKTWGSLLQAAKINPKVMQQEISVILKLRP